MQTSHTITTTEMLKIKPPAILALMWWECPKSQKVITRDLDARLPAIKQYVVLPIEGDLVRPHASTEHSGGRYNALGD